jgi:phage antirepressor YoqD-like protein
MEEKQLQLNENKMTVKEVAEALGVDPEAIKKHVRKLYPDLMQNGITTYLDESQVTEIKHHMLPTTSVVGATTDLEMIEQGARFAAWAVAKIREQEAALAEAKPKVEVYEKISDSTGLKSLQEMAKILGYGPNDFFKLLRTEGILYKNNGINLPYQEYIDKGFFVVREEPYMAGSESRVYSRVFVTGNGEIWLTRKIGREV